MSPWHFDNEVWIARLAGCTHRGRVAWPHVSQTAVCDTRTWPPSGARRRVSYLVSDSMSCRRRANEPPKLIWRARASTGVSR